MHRSPEVGVKFPLMGWGDAASPGASLDRHRVALRTLGQWLASRMAVTEWSALTNQPTGRASGLGLSLDLQEKLLVRILGGTAMACACHAAQAPR